nr:HNH endonuclease [Mesobacillus maritimus]
MAKKIKILYKSTCQLCRSKIKSTNGYISEAHHIKPYNITHKGDDSYQNLIVLCPNCHSRFDEYFYAIHPETFTVHCLDTGNENHMKDLYMVKDHTLGQEYLNFAWEVFIGLKDSLNKDNK